MITKKNGDFCTLFVFWFPNKIPFMCVSVYLCNVFVWFFLFFQFDWVIKCVFYFMYLNVCNICMYVWIGEFELFFKTNDSIHGQYHREKFLPMASFSSMNQYGFRQLNWNDTFCSIQNFSFILFFVLLKTTWLLKPTAVKKLLETNYIGDLWTIGCFKYDWQ